jgi:hypothetical protein
VKLLAIGRPRDGADPHGAIARLASAEMRALWALYRDGVVREMYSPGGPGAVLVLEAGTKGDAMTALATLPLVASHVISFELIELHPFGALDVLFAADGPAAPGALRQKPDPQP